MRREVVEDLGTELSIAGLLLVDWAPAPKEGDEIGTTASHNLAAIDDLMPDRRVRAALDAAPGRSEHYAEHSTSTLA
ncbi:hypothetical protein [Kineococcus aurantiacus]|uniref:Uncharacterized protein n=1 Tax=Kineococcus aurantiacus TaxID=37633 RepID=A0A7Y9DLH1_9ACTN|nr:hypothetical protein [Kineococcus aurantiacus]NYD22810.1 hypothetical protein [Kineococcus aurantiacus]